MYKYKFNKWIRSIADMRGWDVNEILMMLIMFYFINVMIEIIN